MTGLPDLAGLRVLVVEDEMMVSMLIEDMLQDLGCKVVGPASRLEEAIELANNEELDCAVLDVNLGGGETVFPQAEALRARGVPFVFATGYGILPSDGYPDTPLIRKPVDQDQLLPVVRAFAALA